MSIAEAFEPLSLLPDLHRQIKQVGNELAAVRNELAKKPVPNEDRWLTVKEARAYLGNMCEATFNKYLNDPHCEVPSSLVGGKRLLKRSELDTWVKLHEIRSQCPLLS